jgi:hypothetical protein
MYHVLEEREDVNQQVATRWNTVTNETELVLVDKSTGRSFCRIVEADRLRDAFVHPWCYVDAGRRRRQ